MAFERFAPNRRGVVPNPFLSTVSMAYGIRLSPAAGTEFGFADKQKCSVLMDRETGQIAIDLSGDDYLIRKLTTGIRGVGYLYSILSGSRMKAEGVKMGRYCIEHDKDRNWLILTPKD
jgi:hypothetical protein